MFNKFKSKDSLRYKILIKILQSYIINIINIYNTLMKIKYLKAFV